MAQREKRSISLPPDLAADIEAAAAAESTTVSAWIAATARRRLRLEAGRHGIAAWEREHGALTPEELAEGLARARALLAAEPAPATTPTTTAPASSGTRARRRVS